MFFILFIHFFFFSVPPNLFPCEDMLGLFLLRAYVVCSLPQVTPLVAAASPSHLTQNPQDVSQDPSHSWHGRWVWPMLGLGTQRAEALNLQRLGLPAGYKVPGGGQGPRDLLQVGSARRRDDSCSVAGHQGISSISESRSQGNGWKACDRPYMPTTTS